MKRLGTQGTLIVCGQVYGAGQVVSTFCDRGHNAVLLRGGIVPETFFSTTKSPEKQFFR